MVPPPPMVIAVTIIRTANIPHQDPVPVTITRMVTTLHLDLVPVTIIKMVTTPHLGPSPHSHPSPSPHQPREGGRKTLGHPAPVPRP